MYEKNIPEEEAVEKLIELIKRTGITLRDKFLFPHKRRRVPQRDFLLPESGLNGPGIMKALCGTLCLLYDDFLGAEHPYQQTYRLLSSDFASGAPSIFLYSSGAVNILAASFKSSSSFNCWIMLPR